MSDRATPVWKLAAIFVALAGAVWLVFGQTLGHQFVNFDDESYVYANPFISREGAAAGGESKQHCAHPNASV